MNYKTRFIYLLGYMILNWSLIKDCDGCCQKSIIKLNLITIKIQFKYILMSNK